MLRHSSIQVIHLVKILTKQYTERKKDSHIVFTNVTFQ